MTRTVAREIALQLCFAAASANLEPNDLLEEFFTEEHYSSLATEQELFSERHCTLCPRRSATTLAAPGLCGATDISR